MKVVKKVMGGAGGIKLICMGKEDGFLPYIYGEKDGSERWECMRCDGRARARGEGVIWAGQKGGECAKLD